MTQFHLATAAQILEAVRADATLTQAALATLAQRTLREHPRRQSVDALAELTGQPRYADLPKGDHVAYNAWVANLRTLAAQIAQATGVNVPAKAAKPKASPKAKAAPKAAPAKVAPAKGSARAKTAPAKAPAGIDVDALTQVVTQAAAKAAQEVLVAYLSTLK